MAIRRTSPAGYRVSREQRYSQRVLALATFLFVLCSGFAVYVLSTMVTTTLTELVYLVDTTCVVHKITLHEEPVPCIVPTCGNVLTQSGCRQTGYCIRVALNFSIKDEHAKLLKMPVEHTSSAPMAELKLHDQYKRAYGTDADGTGGIPCVGFKAGVEGDRKCRPTKTYDTAMYAPSVAVTLPAADTDVAEADGRKLELLDPTDSGRCFAISCREDGARARREALQLMSYWPEGSTLSSCHYLRSFNPVRAAATLSTNPYLRPDRPDRPPDTPRPLYHCTTTPPAMQVDEYLNDGSPPVIVSKHFDPIRVGYWAATVRSRCRRHHHYHSPRRRFRHRRHFRHRRRYRRCPPARPPCPSAHRLAIQPARRSRRYAHGSREPCTYRSRLRQAGPSSTYIPWLFLLPWQAIFVWIMSCQICLERLQNHHDVGNKGTSDDFLHGVAGSRDKKKLANLRGAGRRA